MAKATTNQATKASMPSAKSVWIVKQYAVPPDIAGNTRHYEIARRLVQRGYDVTIIAASFHYSQHKEMRLAPGQSWVLEEVDGVRFAWIRSRPFQRNDWRRGVHMLSFMLNSYRLGRKLSQIDSRIPRPDVIVGCSVPPFAALSGYWLSRRYKSRFMFEVGDLWPQTLIDMGAISDRHPVTWFLRRIERLLYDSAETIITSLPGANVYIEELGVPQGKVVWIPNGFDPEGFDIVSETQAPEGAFTVLYMGTHTRAIGLDTLLHAARIIQSQGYDGIRFTLVGDGAEKPNLRRLASELGLGNVEFRDSVPRNEIPGIMAQSSATAFMFRRISVIEKYGIGAKKLYEYLASGLPLIFSAAAPNNPVEEAGCGVSVPPENPEAMAKAIVQLYKMPESQRVEMGMRGRRYVEESYSWSRLANQFQECIEGRTTIEAAV